MSKVEKEAAHALWGGRVRRALEAKIRDEDVTDLIMTWAKMGEEAYFRNLKPKGGD